MIVLVVDTCEPLDLTGFNCEPAVVEDEPVVVGTDFVCTCTPDEGQTHTDSIITFPTNPQEYRYTGAQTLVAKCVAQDTYKVTLPEQDDLPFPFVVKDGLEAECDSD